MALPSPVAAIPDMGAIAQQHQARSQGLMQAAWAQLKQSNDKRAYEAAASQAASMPQQTNRPTHQGPGSDAYAAGIQGYGKGPVGPYSGTEEELLAKTLMAEAGGEGYDGMIAAGSVINNRVSSGSYGKGLEGVIMRPGQFSAWNGVTGYAGGEGALNMDSINPNEDARRAAAALVSGQYQDPTGGATHYYNPAVATPKWGQSAGGNWTTIGNHIFGFGDAKRS